MLHRMIALVRHGMVWGIAGCLLGACGGGADTPVVTVPPVLTVPPAVPRVWSAPQLSNVWLNSPAVSAYADRCGGVTLLLGQVSAYSHWLTRQFSPATGWKQTLPLSFISAGQAPRPVNVNGVLHVFYRDDAMWRQAQFDCARNEWSVASAFPVAYTSDTTPPLAIEVSFLETYDHNILASSMTTDRSAVNLREFRNASWSAASTLAVNQTSAPFGFSLASTTVFRTSAGDVAFFQRFNTGWFEFRPKSTGDFIFLSESVRQCSSPLGITCAFTERWGGPDVQPDGSVTAFSYTGFDVNPKSFRIGAAGLQLLTSSSTANLLLGEFVVRADGIPQWVLSEPDTKVANIFEAGVKATWLSASTQERLGCTAGCRTFSRPDAGHVATFTDAQAIAISNRVSDARWEGTEELNLASLTTAYTDLRAPAVYRFTPITFHADANVQIIVGVMKRSFSSS